MIILPKPLAIADLFLSGEMYLKSNTSKIPTDNISQKIIL